MIVPVRHSHSVVPATTSSRLGRMNTGTRSPGSRERSGSSVVLRCSVEGLSTVTSHLWPRRPLQELTRTVPLTPRAALRTPSMGSTTPANSNRAPNPT